MNQILNRVLNVTRLLNTKCGCRSAITYNLSNNRTFATKSSKTSGTVDEDIHKPIDFLNSPAAQWKAQWSSGGAADTSPWFESYIILASISVFMIYFCILREENDLDEQLRQPLNDHIPGIEQQTLLTNYLFNARNGGDNRAVEARMRELGMDVEKIRREYVS